MLTDFRVFVAALCCFSVYKSDALNIKDGSEPFFRRDYTYVAQQEAWYKVHPELSTWFEAYQSCKLEGGALLYPSDQAEDALLREMVNEHMSKGTSIWVGAHALFVDNIFVDLHDKEISDYYAPWVLSKVRRARRSFNGLRNSDYNRLHGYPPAPSPSPLRPRRANYYCVSHNFNDDGTIDNKPCFEHLPFVCKKNNLGSMVNTVCQTIDMDYKPNRDGTKCYKIHKEPNSWNNAYATCHAEQSYLVIINDEEEAKFIVKSVKDVVDKMGDNSKKRLSALVGFHDKFVEGDYVTIHGESLDEVYHEWAEKISTDSDHYDCGGIRLIDGRLIEINCDAWDLFVCEKEIHAEFQPTTEKETQSETTTNVEVQLTTEGESETFLQKTFLQKPFLQSETSFLDY